MIEISIKPLSWKCRKAIACIRHSAYFSLVGLSNMAGENKKNEEGEEEKVEENKKLYH